MNELLNKRPLDEMRANFETLPSNAFNARWTSAEAL